MNRSIALASLLALAASLVACSAETDTGPSGSGYAPVSPQGTSLRMRADQIGAPSDLHTELCFHYQDTGRRRVVHVTIETFEKIDGLAQWLEDKNRQAAGDGARIEKIGEATCERGDYVQKDGGAERIQHYLTCDRLVGRQGVGRLRSARPRRRIAVRRDHGARPGGGHRPTTGTVTLARHAGDTRRQWWRHGARATLPSSALALAHLPPRHTS